jgi:predicted phosphodiesterase
MAARVAALYDVHGNLPALEAVLDDVRREDVEAIVIGGDAVAGPFPAETFDVLVSLADALFVRGNADRLVVERVEGFGSAWCADQLGAERLAAVEAWPFSQCLDIDGLGEVVFCHATLRTDEEIVTRITAEDEVVAAFPGGGTVVVGHVHVQFDRRYDGLRLVNAGSVGMPYEGRRGAFWALLRAGQVELRRTEYDVDAAVARIRGSGWTERDQLADWLTKPQDPTEVTEVFEARRAA